MSAVESSRKAGMVGADMSGDVRTSDGCGEAEAMQASFWHG